MASEPRPADHPKPVPRLPDTPDDPQGDEREGATDSEVGDRTGPGAGYDNEPEQEKDPGGVS
jgi:hypothetical protein